MPAATADRYVFRSSSEPASRIGIVPSLFTLGISDDDAQARATSSMTMQVASASAPAPPYSSGMWGAAKSAAASASYDACGNSADSSTSAACGATLASHTARTASRIAWCSSERPYIGASLMPAILLVSRLRAVQPGSDRSRAGTVSPMTSETTAPWLDRRAIQFMLEDCQTWAVVGLSGNPHRTAFRIAEFLQGQGKRIVPIHPSAPTVLEQQGYATLADVPFDIDVVDVFRRSEAAGEFADQAVCGRRQGRLVPARRGRRGRLRADPCGRRADGDGHLPQDRVAAHRVGSVTPPPSRPSTRRGEVVETLHGHQVADPYRWLEDPDSEETAAWVRAQNEASRAHLDALASRPWFLRTLRSIVGRPRGGTPEKVGGRYVVSRNDGTQEQDVWFVGETLDDLVHQSRLLLDPNTFSEDGTSSLAGYNASRDGRWLAYLVSDGGSDWTTIRLLELRHRPRGRRRRHEGEVQRGHLAAGPLVVPLPHVPHHRQRRRHRGRGARPAGRLMRHYVGESQDTDELVLELPDEPNVIPEPTLSHDGRWLAVHLHDGTSEKNRLWLLPGHHRRRREHAGRAGAARRRGVRRLSSWSASTAPRSTC